MTGPARAGVPASRADTLRKLEEIRELKREWIRRAVLERDRIDILATEVLGYKIAPHHLRLAKHQVRYSTGGNLVLIWRGAGKTTIGTITRTIFLLLKNPSIRILLASKSQGNAAGFLADIKGHLKSEKFREIFGDLQPTQPGYKWDDVEIDIATRPRKEKESSVTCVGVEGSVASKHYDVIIADDLVDEENARTPLMRAKVQTFYYKILVPCLVPGGDMTVLGTRYHYADLYGHLSANESTGDRTLLIPAMTGNDTDGWVATWEDGGFSTEFLLALRKSMGSIIFDSQYLMTTDKMRGEIFDPDYFVEVDDADIPSDLPAYTAVDLAISQKETADYFAEVSGVYDRLTDTVYVIEAVEARKPFRDQRDAIVETFKRLECERAGVEATAYQAAQIQEIIAANPELAGRIKPIYPKDDKVTRAWRLAAKIEDGKVKFRKGLRNLIDHLILFPRGEHDDLFDALDHLVLTCRTKVKKERREMGLP